MVKLTNFVTEEIIGDKLRHNELKPVKDPVGKKKKKQDQDEKDGKEEDKKDGKKKKKDKEDTGSISNDEDEEVMERRQNMADKRMTMNKSYKDLFRIHPIGTRNHSRTHRDKIPSTRIPAGRHLQSWHGLVSDFIQARTIL